MTDLEELRAENEKLRTAVIDLQARLRNAVADVGMARQALRHALEALAAELRTMSEEELRVP